MSKLLINQYYINLERAVQFGKSKNEQSIRNHFWNLLNDYARIQNYEVVTEVSCMGTKGHKVIPDGILKNLFGLDIGYWESKDEKDNIDDEIITKQKKGYPFTNILFEDSHTAVLFQRGEEVMRILVHDADKLNSIIKTFITFKSENVYNFEIALENFKTDIPVIVETLRKRIEEAGTKNKNFVATRNTFFELCKAEINPEITLADIREMMIQHILTSDIFSKIFNDPEFHRHNNIACELEKLVETLFNFSERRNLLGSIDHYYVAINAAAAGVTDHHDKQKFLKVLYENFYKVYNPKAADRLGVVYTPNEIVNFMIESTNYLLEKHFRKNLADKNVDILDPATGTGTFITSIIDSIPIHQLLYKYQNEIFANEVAILPYYIANLNVEFTFKQKMGYYEEFKNLCFVDTLDNTDALAYRGKQHSLFGLSSENTERIKRQNSKKISVIIGNPPYNANQLNENENNKKRDYPVIDKRINETYIKYSNAQKTKVYDMYSRFFRWATDRINDDGILCFITNSSYLNAKGFDGFRKSISEEFQLAYIIDLGGDIREKTSKKGATGNVFGIMTGIAIAFLLKKKQEKSKCKIYYSKISDELDKKDKLELLRNIKIESLEFENIRPDKNENWLAIGYNNFDSLFPLYEKGNKKTLFNIYSNGVGTNRDEWVYDFSKNNLVKKINYFLDEYNSEVHRWTEYKKKNKYFDIKAESNPVVDTFLHSRNLIKWSKMIKRDKLRKEKKAVFNTDNIRKSHYRPFILQYLYFGYIPIDIKGSQPFLFPESNSTNKVICFANNEQTDILVISINTLCDLNFCARGSTCLPLYRYNEDGQKTDNITDWGLEQFCKYYGFNAPKKTKAKQKTSKTKNIVNTENLTTSDNLSPELLYDEYDQSHLQSNDNQLLHEPVKTYRKDAITKEDIFHYTYAVLHNPAYRKKYELNLKREFPRLPFYKDFRKWAAWGKALMDLHINYEKVKPFALKKVEIKSENKNVKQGKLFNEQQEPESMFAHKPKFKVKLKADKETGIIELDEETSLHGIPKEVWEYKLGNRSAIEWILDQYKENKPSDQTIAEKFNTYRFADYKTQVIDLLKRVCTVSMETMKIINEMIKV